MYPVSTVSSVILSLAYLLSKHSVQVKISFRSYKCMICRTFKSVAELSDDSPTGDREVIYLLLLSLPKNE